MLKEHVKEHKLRNPTKKACQSMLKALVKHEAIAAVSTLPSVAITANCQTRAKSGATKGALRAH